MTGEGGEQVPTSARGTFEEGLPWRVWTFLDKMTRKETPGNSGMLAARLDIASGGGQPGLRTS